MESWLDRSEKLFGNEGIKRLSCSRVAVFGLGGVGGYVIEALARSGVGALDLIDNDTVSITNLNRQLFALHSTLGQKKTEAAARRVLDINPEIILHLHDCFFLPETANAFDFAAYDYVVDAIDTVKGKIALAVQADKAGTPIISSMGFANKMDPTRIQVTDIYKTSVCPLAKAMRAGLRKGGIDKLKVVFSDEAPLCSAENERDENGRRVIGSNAFVPAAAGLILAGEVVKDLAGCR